MKALLFISSKDIRTPSQTIIQLKKNLSVNDVQIEEVDVDSPDGSQRASSYDAMSFPALVLLREDGALQSIWQGEMPDYGLITQSVGHI